MARQKGATPASVSDARLRWLDRQQRKISSAYDLALDAGSYQAANGFARELRHLRDQSDNEKAKRAEAAAHVANRNAQRADLDPDQWLALVREDARSAMEDELEVYVSRWLEVKGYRLTVDSGELRIARIGA